MIYLTVFARYSSSLALLPWLSYHQRTHEIGVRVALGARPGSILTLMIRQGFVLASIGTGIGLICAFLLTRVMSSLLFEVGATDPFTFVATPLLVASVSLLASYIPARRAARVDPMVALRCE